MQTDFPVVQEEKYNTFLECPEVSFLGVCENIFSSFVVVVVVAVSLKRALHMTM